MAGTDAFVTRHPRAASLPIIAATLWPQAAQAAPALDGSQMGAAWALPFTGILLSIALGPMLLSKIWHAHYGKIAALWAIVTLAAIAAAAGVSAAIAAFMQAMLGEYMSFIILLFALYTVAGGLLITASSAANP